MLDLPRLRRIRLSPTPISQRVVATFGLGPNYTFLPGVDIRIEGASRLPSEPVIFAMNHTDRFNYWPFMYKMWRAHGRFMAVWVKGKYYESTTVGAFMEIMNNLPTVSRGYVIARDFLTTMERTPDPEEYTVLRDLVSRAAHLPATAREGVNIAALPTRLLETPRNMLGVRFDPRRETYEACVNRLFFEMMVEFGRLNRRAFDLGLDLLIFPQGTRSKRLARGHVGVSQIALRHKRTIVPIGCNGSDYVYPGESPFARKGTIVYRVGEPIRHEDLSEFHVPEAYTPFSHEAESKYGTQFQGVVDLVMDRINGLLDPEYQFGEDKGSTGVAGIDRFL